MITPAVPRIVHRRCTLCGRSRIGGRGVGIKWI